MKKLKILKRKNKTLIDVPYYDEFIRNPDRKIRYFKRYPKTYKLKKKITKKSFVNHLGRKDKDVTFIIETNHFYLLLKSIACISLSVLPSKPNSFFNHSSAQSKTS